MRILKKIQKIFSRADDLRERIENAIAIILEQTSESKLLDSGQEIILNSAIEVIEAYASEKSGKNINIPKDMKKSIIQGIVSGHNKLQKKIAAILRK